MKNPPEILIVDDTPDNVVMISWFLEKEGYIVFSTNNGEDGYNMALSRLPDLILLDIMMPGKNGYEVCKSLKANKITSDIPVIFVTAKSGTGDKIKGLDAGGIDYITKPFHHAEVMARVRTHLKLKAIYEENLEYQRELLRSQKMASITSLAGGIAHNINNLMGTVIGYTDMLRGSFNGNSKVTYYTDIILEASQRVADLTRNLLVYAEMEQGTISRVNIKELLERMIQLYGSRNQNGVRIDLNLNITKDVTDIYVDRDKIFQALSNILINAQEVTPDNGIVSIKVSRGQLPEKFYCRDPGSVNGEYVIISISDSGPGMDEETVDKIFDPFFTTKQTVGSGLGLSAACGIIRRHKGVISVDTKLGKGSTFHVYLPMSQGG